jgi:hypothetical protein
MCCSFAAEGGQLEVLQWLREQNCSWDAWTCAAAAFGGYLELLQCTTARGMHGRANGPKRKATWSCCSGRWSTVLLCKTRVQCSRMVDMQQGV